MKVSSRARVPQVTTTPSAGSTIAAMSSLVLATMISSALTAPVLRDHDRVVFLGDSITVLHTWTRLIEVAVRLRHPEWSVSFINAGVGGNTVADALDRLDTDVFAHQPTVVFLNFGMNDASYPEGTSDAAFEKNMLELFDRLKQGGVRDLVWLDTTPYDTSVGSGNAFNRRRVARIAELLEFTKKTGIERGVPVVKVNEAVTRAITSWKAAGRAENLMPDRIHPGPQLHAVMAAATLEAIGFDVRPSRVKLTQREGMLAVPGVDGGVPWTMEGPVQLEEVSARPLPFVNSLVDAKALDSKPLASLGSLMVSVEGLPAKQRFLVRAGTVELGRFTGAQLSTGVEVMQTFPPRVAPGPGRADLSVCSTLEGNPWVNDVACAFNLLFGKDQLRITMRHEKTRGLPDSVPGYLERLTALQVEWLEAVERDLERRVVERLAVPHTLTLVPDGADAGSAR